MHASRAEQQPDDRRLEYGDSDCRKEDQPKIGAHNSHVDAHADAHEEQGQQETAEWLDVGFELVSVVRFGEQHSGEEGP